MWPADDEENVWQSNLLIGLFKHQNQIYLTTSRSFDIAPLQFDQSKYNLENLDFDKFWFVLEIIDNDVTKLEKLWNFVFFKSQWSQLHVFGENISSNDAGIAIF